MEEEEDCRVPQNSFADKRDLINSARSKKSQKLSLTTTNNKGTRRDSAEGNWPPRPSPCLSNEYSKTPPASRQFRSHSREISPLKSTTQFSEISYFGNGYSTTPGLTPSPQKMYYDKDMQRSGHAAVNDLKSRLYDRPGDSDVFKTIDTGNAKITTKKVQWCCSRLGKLHQTQTEKFAEYARVHLMHFGPKIFGV